MSDESSITDLKKNLVLSFATEKKNSSMTPFTEKIIMTQFTPLNVKTAILRHFVQSFTKNNRDTELGIAKAHANVTIQK